MDTSNRAAILIIRSYPISSHLVSNHKPQKCYSKFKIGVEMQRMKTNENIEMKIILLIQWSHTYYILTIVLTIDPKLLNRLACVCSAHSPFTNWIKNIFKAKSNAKEQPHDLLIGLLNFTCLMWEYKSTGSMCESYQAIDTTHYLSIYLI